MKKSIQATDDKKENLRKLPRILTFGAFFAVIANECPGAGIALVYEEITALRAVLESDPRGSGLDSLSGDGKNVLQDVACIAIVVDDRAGWQYRHNGNNRELFPKSGSPNDLACLEAALKSKPYLWLTHVTNQLPNETSAAQFSSAKQDTLEADLRSTRDDPGLTPELKKLVYARVGAAVAGMTGDVRGRVLSSPQSHPELNVALKNADANELSRVNTIAHAKTDTDPGKLSLISNSALAGEHALTTTWTAASSAAGEKVFSTDVSPGIKAYVAISGNRHLSPQTVKPSEWGGLIRDGEAKVYYGEVGKKELLLLDKHSLEASLPKEP
jgi:hypothetical protein